MAMHRVLLGFSLVFAQARQEVTLNWELPHNRAAVYEMVDGASGAALRDLWLVGCELGGHIDAFHTSDIPLKYLFQVPKAPIKPGVPWTTQDRRFSECTGAIPPLEITGSYFLHPTRTSRVEEVFHVVSKGKKPTKPIPLGLLEGRFQVFRGNWVNDKPGSFEKIPSATFSTLTAVRLTDGVIVAASYQWMGRADEYTGTFSTPTVARRTLSRELLFQEQYVDLSREGLKERIDRAVERGTKWLLTTQSQTGSFTDPLVMNDRWAYAKEFVTALSLMALTHSGVTDNKQLEMGFAYLDSRRLNQSWDIGLCLMSLESRYLPLSFYEDLTAYSEDRAREHIAKAITKKDKARAEELAQILLGYQSKSGGFGYSESDSDNIQTTQYAVLGLKSASRLGVRIPLAVWRGIVRYFETTLASSGQSVKVKLTYLDGRKETEKTCYEHGWIYRPRTIPPRYAETNGIRVMSALASVAICQSELRNAKALDEDISRRLTDLGDAGLAWWARHPGMRTAQHEGCSDIAAMTYFYLWSAERAGVFLGIDKINDHSWYFEGAAHILVSQAPDGHWDGLRGTPIVDTACALLFLKRATIPVETPAGAGKRSVATEGEKKPAPPKEQEK